jgi:flavodoxin
MNVLVIYDTVFGNTEKIAQQIGSGMQSKAFVQVVKVNDVTPAQIQETDYLIIGSPTRGFKATEGINELVKGLTLAQLEGKQIAVFDTRLDLQETKSAFARFMIKTGGFAANKMAKELKKNSIELSKEPEGFLVFGEKGENMVAGEPERAAGWGKNLI